MTTAQLRFFNGIPCVLPNSTGDVDTGSQHWYVSYNDRDRGIYGSDTTALVIGQMEYFIILDGDHRQGLRDAINDSSITSPATRLARCLAYVRDHSDNLNSKYSDPII